MSSISFFDIISVVYFLCIHASAADAAAINPKEIKTLLPNGLITFFISGNPVFSNRPSNLPKNPPDCIILDNWVFGNLISADEWFVKDLRRFETSLLVNNNSWGKFVPLSPIILDNNLKTTSVSFFIADLNLIALHLNYCIVSFYTDKN